jgi:hypothetical protein
MSNGEGTLSIALLSGTDDKLNAAALLTAGAAALGRRGRCRGCGGRRDTGGRPPPVPGATGEHDQQRDDDHQQGPPAC